MLSRTIATILVAGLVTACGDDPISRETEASPPTSSPSAPEVDPSAERSLTRSTEPAARGTKVIAAGSDVGTVLFDGTGQAIYLFDVETTSRPRCYGPCADAWPPVLTEGDPRGDEQVEGALLATTQRSDGTTQVTYDGHPLYFYAHEGKREVTCHDVFLNGGNWYAVQPDGRRALS